MISKSTVSFVCIVRVYMSLNIQSTIQKRLQKGFEEALSLDGEGLDPLLRKSQNPEHGDYQSNGAMGLGKKHGMNPRELAEKVISVVDLSELAHPLEIAGPGFINIKLKDDTILALIRDMDNDPELGINQSEDTHPVAIDLCGVNVAKQLHVGHLRSTIIGDALARMFERVGRKVYRENHLGDWGLPIAMVLERLMAHGVDLDTLSLDALNDAYRDAQLGACSDERGLARAIERDAGPHRIIELETQNKSASLAQQSAKELLIALQKGDERLVQEWEKLIGCTMRSVFESLGLLNVKIGPEHNRGESFYRDQLGGVVEEFVSSGLAVEDGGALVVRFENRERPMLIRKSDGGFLYATTDLAAINFRTQTLESDQLIYVVDARQRDHFKDLFDAATLIGWNKTPDGAEVDMVHIPFGSVLGEDKKPLKTRSGSNVTLSSLLEEAIERGVTEVKKRSADPNAPTHGMAEELLCTIGRQIGIGAVKYADLSNDLVRDYVFDMDRMVAFEGNTGPYIQYACARIRSLVAKCGEDWSGANFIISAPEERALVMQLLQYNTVFQGMIQGLEPHRLCTWLYELTESFNTFYQACPVLKVDNPQIKLSRVRLAHLTKKVLVDGLDVLGIESPEHM